MTIKQGAFVPMATPERGKPWFALCYVRQTRKQAKADFIADCCNRDENWNTLKKEGWRIVRVMLES